MPTYEEIVNLVKWTMTFYGSDAGEKANPGSKLQAQAEHIAETLLAYEVALACLPRHMHVKVILVCN